MIKWIYMDINQKLPAFTYDVLCYLKSKTSEKTLIMQGYLLMGKWKIYSPEGSAQYLHETDFDIIRWAEIPKS